MTDSIVNDSNFDIRYTEKSEEEILKQWMMNPDVLLWYPISDEKEVSDFVRNWIGFSRFHCSLTATYKGQPCGMGTLFLMPYRKVMHLCLTYIIVAPKFQRKGVGTALIKNLKHLGKNFFRLQSVHLEVYGGCPVIGLLEKQGFKRVILQEHFVKLEDRYLSRLIYEAVL